MVRRCTILHQSVAADAPLDEQDTLLVADAVARSLSAAGWQIARCQMTLDLAAAEATLTAQQPDLVFNLVESLDGADVLSVAAPALLERLGLRYTGAGLAAVALTADKRATRHALRRAGIAVPPGPEDGWAGPFIVKHATNHASFGLGPQSVVDRLGEIPAGWYAEAFMDGREFNISLLADGVGGVAALPAAELLFQDWPAGVPRVCDYASKWQLDHLHFQCTERSFAVPPDLGPALQQIAVACWHALGLAGYARIDLRFGVDGIAYVIDVNANPCLDPDAGVAAAAAAAGLDYSRLVGRIADAALGSRLGEERPLPLWEGVGGGAAPPMRSSENARPLPPARSHKERGRELSPAHQSRACPGRPRPIALRAALRDADDIAGICRATGFFTPDEVAIAEELATDRRERGQASSYRFQLADDALGLAGYACYGPTAGTAEAWDLYWIVVHPRAQGSGVGRHLVAAVLDDMRASGGRRLYAETAGKPPYAPTRAFYAAAGFALQAVVPDFYAPGDAKQIWLRLAA